MHVSFCHATSNYFVQDASGNKAHLISSNASFLFLLGCSLRGIVDVWLSSLVQANAKIVGHPYIYESTLAGLFSEMNATKKNNFTSLGTPCKFVCQGTRSAHIRSFANKRQLDFSDIDKKMTHVAPMSALLSPSVSSSAGVVATPVPPVAGRHPERAAPPPPHSRTPPPRPTPPPASRSPALARVASRSPAAPPDAAGTAPPPVVAAAPVEEDEEARRDCEEAEADELLIAQLRREVEEEEQRRRSTVSPQFPFCVESTHRAPWPCCISFFGLPRPFPHIHISLFYSTIFPISSSAGT